MEASKTAANFNANKTKKSKGFLPLIDTAILTMEDFNRIRKNAQMLTQEETLNQNRILTEQKNAKLAKAIAHKEKLHSYDMKKTNKYEITDIDRENMELNAKLLKEAQRQLDKNEDCVKDMEKLVQYAKMATIRDKQKEEHRILNTMNKKKEAKLDILMELDRLKDLKRQQDREEIRKKQIREGGLIVREQIKEREREREKLKEILEKDRVEILKHIKKMQDDELEEMEQRRIHNEKIAKEIEHTNMMSAQEKERKKREEREFELKIMKYNLEKIKKEEEELAEKKRLHEEKEKEIQKLREKQEKARDKQADLDALRAKRAFEENERQIRQKEKEELILRQKRLEELLAFNEKQKMNKELMLAEQAKQEQEEFERIIKKQLDDIERERKLNEERKKMRYEHNNQLRKMMKLREEKEKVNEREVLEEGRKNAQKYEAYLERMEKIKKEKLKELYDMNINPKYIADLERYKII